MVWNSRPCLQDVCDKKSRTHSHVSGGAFTMYQQLSEEGKVRCCRNKESIMICFFNRQIHCLWTVYCSSSTFWGVCQCISSRLALGEYWNRVGMCFCSWTANMKETVVSSRRAKLNVSQLLSRGQAVMKDEMSTKEPFAAATHPIETDVPLLFTKCPTNISCDRCSEANCYAKDCQYWPAGINASCYQ